MLYLFRSSVADPYRNLAVEEHFYDTFPLNAVVVGLYVNSACIVIGKHQNPWREIDLAAAVRSSVPVLRRISGGGAVYHDKGNLVFTVMARRNVLDRRRNLDFIRSALESLSVRVRATPTFDLFAGDRKISGNSFCFRRDRALHHGTILVSADRDLMKRLLKREEPQITTHAVASRPAPTINLVEIDSDITIERIERAILRAAVDVFGSDGVVRLESPGADDAEVRRIERRRRGWEWVYGRTPAFDVSFPRSGTLRLRVRHGIVEEVIAASDREAAELLRGTRFELQALLAALGPPTKHLSLSGSSRRSGADEIGSLLVTSSLFPVAASCYSGGGESSCIVKRGESDRSTAPFASDSDFGRTPE